MVHIHLFLSEYSSTIFTVHVSVHRLIDTNPDILKIKDLNMTNISQLLIYIVVSLFDTGDVYD